jgi:glyoxylate utilization-related uncharacterized protein
MTETVNQPSANPTNKLTAATIGAATLSVSGLIVRNLFPEWYDQDVWLSMAPVVVFALGWFIKDKPNVVVVVEEKT